ncbi:hypothetical protein J1N35_014700 [Gossypium stocksii]|uniref:RNase H type-1 domain-containing protein n=1 Tax=Gossypium stocksii TaxID=47602 RepID=A0A9D3VWW7_9ROSI|nr:hypothetical protein J1N35_014700 [Gossypium stocksii]
MGWRVGRGDGISVWQDRWIQGQITDNRSGQNDSIELVSDLINASTRTWKTELINTTFSAEVAQQILEIPPSETPCDDFQVWRGEPSGIFSVRSAYKLLKEASLDPNFLIQANFKEFYKKLWNLLMPTKITITIWRISWNCIPNLVNLRSKRVLTDAMYPRCGIGEEDSAHVFRQCPITAEVWQSVECFAVVYGSSGTREIDLCMTGKQTEAYAGLQAIKLGLLLDLHLVVIKGDSRSVIQKCQTKEQDKSVIGAIIRDIQSRKARFHEIDFQFIHRIDNNHAHKAAIEALRREKKRTS